ncbi:glycosyltransferase family 4 protein [Ferdinandcohnia sp. SAFN-114]
MKILFTFHLGTGGIVTLNLQRFQALQSKDFDCHFLYLTGGAGIKNMKGTKTFITNDDEKIKEIIEREQYDLVVVILDYLFVLRLRRLGYNGKLIYDIQGFGTEINNLLELAKKHIIGQVDGIMFPRTPHLQNLIDFHFPSVQKFSFHNCINTTSFTYLQLPKPQKTIIGWVGRIEPNKNWKLFLQLGAELIRDNQSIELWMFEDPTTADKLERIRFKKWLEKLNLKKHLLSHYNISYDKMPEYYSMIGESGGFLCSTSKKEGFGYAVIEAMSCNCPVLCTDSDGIKSFVHHNKTGKIMPHDDLQTVVLEAKELLYNEDLRNRLRKEAFLYVNKKFNPLVYKENFLNMLTTIGL